MSNNSYYMGKSIFFFVHAVRWMKTKHIYGIEIAVLLLELDSFSLVLFGCRPEN